MTIEEVFSDAVDEGNVVDTSPAAGTLVERGTQVTMRVSKGAERVEVPDVGGETEENARSAIEGAGLRVGKITEQESKEEPGTVLSQSPAAGKRVAKNSAVELTVAKGVEIPDVVDETEDDATQRARGRRLRGPRPSAHGDDRRRRRARARAAPGGRRGARSGQHRHDHRRRARAPDADAVAHGEPDGGPVRVAVLAGGRSSEHDVSLSSAAYIREQVAAAGHEVVPVTIERSGAWVHDGRTLALTPGEGLLGTDAVFPALHGPFGEDGTVQGLLELLDVPYVGAGVLASSLCMDKVVFKEVLAAADVPQVASLAVREHRWHDERDAVIAELAVLGKPVFVKPARLGSSVGIAKAWGEADLATAVDAAFTHDSLVIAEAFSDGIEVECSVLGNERPEASVPGEIVVLKGDWYDYEAKYSDGGMELIVPARLPDTVDRAGPCAGGRHVRARRLRRAGARRLLRRGRPRARQ